MTQRKTQRKEIALQVHEDLPAFIFGLPEDLFDADLAKSKFADTISFLKKMVPEIEEARCKMKMVYSPSRKSRYEVDVSIITPYARHADTNSDRDLAKVFDEMSESPKKRFAQEKQRGSKRKSSRHA